jgi:hypothetical protein
MSDNESGAASGGNGNGNGGGGSQHLRVVNLQTAVDKKKQNCVLKLRELLAQAEQGKYIDLIVIAGKPAGDHSLHWTPMAGQEVRFIGALAVMKRILLNSINITRQ